MAAEEQQGQGVVPVRHVGTRDLPRGRRLLPLSSRGVAADLVDQAPARHPDEPGQRVVGLSLGRPPQRCGQQGLLHRVLRGREVTRAAGHDSEGLGRELAQQALAGVFPHLSHGVSASETRRRQLSDAGTLITWRTSIGCWIGTPPGPGAADACAAISTARSGDSTSTIQ